ncbi:MAG: SDR family oxidoreductase [Thaumarchaeota archaeon]|nr:SDR family oxidoreductase [Nitrososphaerota archaeon]
MDVLDCYQNNVFSIFNTLRYSLPIMKSQKNGIIINFSSRCGRRAIPRLAAYCSTKFAVRGITEAVAKETEGTGVRCVSISPAGINTRMRKDLFGEEDAKKQQSPETIADIIGKIIREEIKVPNGADVVIFKDIEPMIKVPEQ